MKKNTFLRISSIALLLLTVTLSGCSKKETLYLFNWTYYTPDSVIAKFEEEFDVKVKVDNFDSNETMYSKLKAGGGGYDIIFPSQDFASILINEKMLEEIDHSKIPNLQYINPEVTKRATYDPDMKYAVPYYMGAAGIAVNKEKVPSYGRSWSIFGNKEYSQHMCMMDDMREVLGDALVHLGYDVNTKNDAELKAATDLVNNEWKPNLVTFDAEGFGKSFARGDFWIVQGYEEVVFSEIPEEQWDIVDFFIPEEGGPMYLDSMCILKGAKHYDLACEFINFIHRPEIYAEFLDYFRFPNSVNTEASAYVLETPAYDNEAMMRCTLKYDLGEYLQNYNDAWQTIRYE